MQLMLIHLTILNARDIEFAKPAFMSISRRVPTFVAEMEIHIDFNKHKRIMTLSNCVLLNKCVGDLKIGQRCFYVQMSLNVCALRIN